MTIYNFYGLVDGSAKSPEGWELSSEEFGRTPYWNGYPLVLPVDVPGTPNLTWTVTKPIAAGAQIDGFTATTRVSAMVYGEYTAQVTRISPAIAASPPECRVPRLWCPNRRLSAGFRRRASSLT